MACQFHGCSKSAFPGRSYCSKVHEDRVLASQWSNPNNQFGGLEVAFDRTTGNPSHRPPQWVRSPPLPRTHRRIISSAVSDDSLIERSVTPPLDPRRRILFYNKGAPYYEFTNFSNHAVWYNQKEYPSSEHLFQSLKFEDAADAERIRLQGSPRAALQEAQRMRSRVRKDWIANKQNIKAMNKVLLLKFTQHERLREMLLNTGDAELVEDSPTDLFWGSGADGNGQNRLGHALMHVRDTLRAFES